MTRVGTEVIFTNVLFRKCAIQYQETARALPVSGGSSNLNNSVKTISDTIL